MLNQYFYRVFFSNLLGTPITNYINELEGYKLICYSVDDDFMIAKVDLDKDSLASAISKATIEENYQLVFETHIRKKP